MKYPEWLRWVSFAASFAILSISLLFPRNYFGMRGNPNAMLIGVYISLVVFPAVLAILLSLAQKWWWLIAPGLWFTFWGVVGRYQKEPLPVPEIYVLAGLVLLIAPVVALAMRRKE